MKSRKTKAAMAKKHRRQMKCWRQLGWRTAKKINGAVTKMIIEMAALGRRSENQKSGKKAMTAREINSKATLRYMGNRGI